MITGYNTDVRHHEVVFHVQTEDKGADNPFIESLVYVGGQVLAAKRAGYAELLGAGGGDRPIVELMERQHRTVIAAIRGGRFDAKLEALVEARKTGGALAAAAAEPAAGAAPSGEPLQAASGSGNGGDTDRTLDQVILEYLTSEADQEQLLLTVDGKHRLGLGAGARLGLRATSSKSGQPVAGARVQVRMISTVADPRVLASGETDREGALALAFEIPKLDRGTAALIITAASTVGHAEIKHLL
ncbi:MAG TPA: hypothetical protein VM599_10945 [Thermoanaerobaculia bacterium]|nr:hypothetical protein [Thermoanaerobaculia bacterium]